jgi:hypothetical protein
MKVGAKRKRHTASVDALEMNVAESVSLKLGLNENSKCKNLEIVRC